jgi:hypothetical protein
LLHCLAGVVLVGEELSSIRPLVGRRSGLSSICSQICLMMKMRSDPHSSDAFDPPIDM